MYVGEYPLGPWVWDRACCGFTLEAYHLINLVDGVLSRKRLKSNESFEEEVSLLEMQSFRRFAAKALPDYDYPSQNMPHRAFWNRLGVNG